jgi:hypothetical protein
VNTSVTDIDLTGRAVDIAAAVKVFEDAEKLAQYLAVEQSAAEPRKMVVKALEDRIAALVKKESHDV